jgi:hypothetical protein
LKRIVEHPPEENIALHLARISRAGRQAKEDMAAW